MATVVAGGIPKRAPRKAPAKKAAAKRAPRTKLTPVQAAWRKADLDALKISPEVAWYMEDRGHLPPTCPPKFKTPEPGEVEPTALFDPERVDRVLASFHVLRHTKGVAAGQPLDPDTWQIAYIIAPWAGWVHWDQDISRYVRVITTLYVDLPRKNGKGVYTGEMILTRNGWIKFGDLKVGDEVHSVDGALVPVTYVSPVHNLDCYEVEFADGQTVTCDEQHLWTVRDRYGHDPAEWSRTGAKGAEVTIDAPTLFKQHRCGKRGDTRYSVRMDRVLDRPEADLPIDPYLLGAWLGDGSTNAARMHGIDMPILDRFAGAGYTVRQQPGTLTYGINGGFLVALRELGVLGNKHVPDRYLTASAAQRMELLRGLMDTDGGPTRGTNTPRVEFSSTKKVLAEAVLFLARSLGWKATITEARATLNGRDCGPKWRVSWTAYNDRSPFYLERKTRVLHAAPTKPTRASTNTIVAVRKVESVPTRCIQVDHPSHLFLVGEGLIPTHNTTLAGGVGMYMTAADGEMGAQVVAAATTRDQAGFAFNPIKQLAEGAPGLRKHVKAYAGKVVHPATASYFQPVANVGDAQHGADLHAAVIDELHLHKTNDLIEALSTGTGSRSQPLIFFITTADSGAPATPYDEQRTTIEQLARGALVDASTYGVVWGAEESDDPFSEATQRKANPGFGISPTRRYLVEAAKKAQRSPAQFASYQRLHLGLRTKQIAKYIRLSDWDANAGPGFVMEGALKNMEAYGGLDLSSTTDVTALCWVFPHDQLDRYSAIWRLWIPEETLDDLARRTADNAYAWVKDGWLQTTPGNVVDYDFIMAQVLEDMDAFDVQSLAFDRWNSSQLVTKLTDDGVPMEAMGQGYASLSAPTKQLQRLVLKGAKQPEDPCLVHGGNPVIRWMMDNLTIATDPAGNVKPDKSTAHDKIDGVAALIDALAYAVDANDTGDSMYEDDEVEFG